MSWRDEAACAGMATDAFYGGSSESEAIKAVCRACPVQAQCLTEALTIPSMDDYGVMGGTTAQERKSLRRKGASVPEPAEPPPEPKPVPEPEPEPVEQPMTEEDRAIVVGLLGLLEKIRAWRAEPWDPNEQPEPVPVMRCRRHRRGQRVRPHR